MIFFAIVNIGTASDEVSKNTISTAEWIFEVTGFKSGLREAKWGQNVLFSTKQDRFKDVQFIRVHGFIRPVLKKNKYTFEFKLKLNEKQNLILVEMTDQEGKNFVAIGDDARFDRSRTIEFRANQFPMKVGICFYLQADIQSFEFSLDDSARLKVDDLQ